MVTAATIHTAQKKKKYKEHRDLRFRKSLKFFSDEITLIYKFLEINILRLFGCCFCLYIVDEKTRTDLYTSRFIVFICS